MGVSNRRPLKSRNTGWAAMATRVVLATGLSANGVSFIGILIAGIGAWALVEADRSALLYLVAAVCIQLRLLANMIDGLVAVEGGRGGPTGAIWNEFPDRIEDSLFLVAAGYAAAIPWLGWLAALLASVCAYVRLLGGTLGLAQDFGGPMAKPHRMAALTIGCLAQIAGLLLFETDRALPIAFALIAAGTALTIARRLIRQSRALRG